MAPLITPRNQYLWAYDGIIQLNIAATNIRFNDNAVVIFICPL